MLKGGFVALVVAKRPVNLCAAGTLVSQQTIAAIGTGHDDLSCPVQAHALLSAACLGHR